MLAGGLLVAVSCAGKQCLGGSGASCIMQVFILLVDDQTMNKFYPLHLRILIGKIRIAEGARFY